MTTVLGLDIGGTRTRARLVRDGAVLAEAQGGSASLTAAGRQQAGAALAAILSGLGLREASLDAMLTRDLLHAAGCPDQRTLLQRFYDDPRPDRWAAHVPAVLGADDPFGPAILDRAAQAPAGLAASCSRRLNAPPDLPVVLAGGLLTGSPALAGRTGDHTRRILPSAPVQTLSRPRRRSRRAGPRRGRGGAMTMPDRLAWLPGFTG